MITILSDGFLKNVKYLKKVNAKSQFLEMQYELLNPELGRLLRNSLIQLHLDYACISWCPLARK